MPQKQSETEQRLDIWLFRTRLLKSRSIAGNVISKGKVRISRHTKTLRIKKPSFNVAIDDEITFMGGTTLFVVKVIDFPARRGPAPEAQEFYHLIPTQTCDSDIG